jgi:predicted XRE-type DNA-binding protein
MTLKHWITKTGRKEVAQMLNIQQSTITTWLQKKQAPKDKVKIKINRLSHGRVSYAEMIEPFHGDL